MERRKRTRGDADVADQSTCKKDPAAVAERLAARKRPRPDRDRHRAARAREQTATQAATPYAACRPRCVRAVRRRTSPSRSYTPPAPGVGGSRPSRPRRARPPTPALHPPAPPISHVPSPTSQSKGPTSPSRPPPSGGNQPSRPPIAPSASRIPVAAALPVFDDVDAKPPETTPYANTILAGEAPPKRDLKDLRETTRSAAVQDPPKDPPKGTATTPTVQPGKFGTSTLMGGTAPAVLDPDEAGHDADGLAFRRSSRAAARRRRECSPRRRSRWLRRTLRPSSPSPRGAPPVPPSGS